MRLTEELILLMLDEQSGYLGMVPDWDFSCVMAGAIIADLTLENRVDTDLDSLYMIDGTPTGDPMLDPVLEEISEAEDTFSTQYWIEKNTSRCDDIVTMTLDRLHEKGILESHSGGFWSLSRSVSRGKTYPLDVTDGSPQKEARTRILSVILEDVIPDPRDVILICLMHTCNGFKLILSMEDYQEKLERIELLTSMDLVGLSISKAVKQSVVKPKTRRIIQTRPIPKMNLSDILKVSDFRRGNMPKAMCQIYEKYGSVVEGPFKMDGERLVLLIGLTTNQWVHKNGRFYLRSKDYIKDLEGALGASRTLPGMDGAEHFRLRKSLRKAYSRATLASRLPELLHHCRSSLKQWKQGSIVGATKTCQNHMSSQVSHLTIGIDCSNYIDDLLAYEHRALNVCIARVMPRFMLSTPRMKRAKKCIQQMAETIQATHTQAQREGKPQDLVDALLEVHRNDPQFLPDTDIIFPFIASMVASIYLGSALAFALYAMVSRPSLYEQVRREADKLFGNGREPSAEDFAPSNIDVANRLFLETERLYPVIPWQFRTVMNRCIVDGHEIPSPTRILICHTATHYMGDVFRDPLEFDIDRYLPERLEHLPPCAYVPYGLGTHTCLGHNWVNLQMVVNLLLIAHHVKLEVQPAACRGRAGRSGPHLHPAAVAGGAGRTTQAPCSGHACRGRGAHELRR